MFKKDVDSRWNQVVIESFARIRKAFGEAPVLVSPDY